MLKLSMGWFDLVRIICFSNRTLFALNGFHSLLEMIDFKQNRPFFFCFEMFNHNFAHFRNSIRSRRTS